MPDPVRRLPTVWRSSNARLLAGVAAVGLAQAALSITLTLGVAHAFDFVLDARHATARTLSLVAAGFLLFALASAAVRYGERTLPERLGQRYVHRVRLRLWDHLQRLPAASITGQRRGATVLRFIGDLTTLKLWVSRGLASTVVAVLTLVGGLVAMALLSWRLAAATSLILVVAVAGQARWSRVVGRRVRALRKQRSRLATDIVERISSLAVVQASNQGQRERRRIRRRSEQLIDASIAAASASGVLLGSSELVSVALMGAVLVLGATQVASAAMTPGAMVASLLLARHLGRPVRSLSRAQERWMRAAVARHKLEQFLALAPIAEPTAATPLKAGGGAIRLARVTSGALLTQISARARSGDRIRLVGANGSGKSTLFRLLAGLERPAAGKIGLDGRDLGRCSLQAIRSAVALVGPDLPLLRGTLRRNLTYGSPRATESEIAEVLGTCDLETLLQTLPQGLATRVADAGLSLSSGQRYRVELGRALLTKPRVLLLDEADRYLDEPGRRAVHQIIASFPGTVVFVWNSSGAPPSTATWRLDNGEISVETAAEQQPPTPILRRLASVPASC